MMSEEGKLYVSLSPNHHTTPLTQIANSMGQIPWKGDLLYSGYPTYIGGKQVELDAQVEVSQLPTMIGGPQSMHPGEDDSANNTLRTPNSPIIITIAPDSPVKKQFIAPASFYGAAPKPKPKGPL